MPDRDPRNDALGKMLAESAERIDFPPTPDLVPAVIDRLERERRPRPGLRRWRTAYGFAAVVVVILTFVSLFPDARRAVANWLGVGGVRIDVVPEGDGSSPPGRLDLGEEVTIDVARQTVPFSLTLPSSGPFERPDLIFLDEDSGTPRVSFVYAPRPGIPPSEVTGTGAILTLMQGDVPIAAVKKVVGPDTRVRATEIDGRPAYWVAGAPHEVQYLDEEGDPLRLSSRLAGNVLLWDRGNITYRLEARFTFKEAIEVARSIP